MIIPAIISAVVVSLFIGRWTFGRWINHIAFYSIPWGFTLVLFHSGLIRYFPLGDEAWMLIIFAWLAFLAGSLTIPAARFSTSRTIPPSSSKRFIEINESTLRPLYSAMWILNIVLIIHTVYEVLNVIRLMGGDPANIVALANVLYNIRVKEGIPGSIPYIGQLVFLGAVLSGIYTSSVGRIRLAAFIPFVIAVVTSFIQVVRALALIVVVLFICAYFLNRMRTEENLRNAVKSALKRFLAVVFLLALLVVTVEVVRSTRGLYERFSGQSGALKGLRKEQTAFISPSIVMYFSVHNGVLDQYLKEDVEHVVWGRYTFAPVWRVLSKLGFDTYVGFYQNWFYNTPVPANTGTYIREIHADFGVSGVVLVPYILGLLCSRYWYRVIEANKILDLTILTHLYSIVAMSWFVMLTQLGGWYLSLIVGIVVSRAVDRKLLHAKLNNPADRLGLQGHSQ